MEKAAVGLVERKKEIIDQISAIVNELPAVFVIHEMPSMNLVYVSPVGLNEIGVRLDQLVDLSLNHNYECFDVEDGLNYVPKVFAMLGRRDPNERVSYFQQVCLIDNQLYSWNLCTTKILLQEDDGTPALTITILQSIDPLHNITHKLDRLLKESNFFKTNYAKYNTLTKRELEVLKLMANSKSVPEIAEILFVSLHTIESHRKNIKKKLLIKTSNDLREYILAFNLL